MERDMATPSETHRRAGVVSRRVPGVRQREDQPKFIEPMLLTPGDPPERDESHSAEL